MTGLDQDRDIRAQGARETYRQARRAAVRGISVSVGLGTFKLIGGLFGHSFALVVDAAHSLGDAVIAGAVFGALVVAQRPADREHPYGHARAETVAGAGVALLLIALAFGLAWDALSTLGGKPVAPSAFTLAIAAVCVLIQEGQYRYNQRVARRTGSRALLATAWDYRFDALSSLAVLAGVAAARWGGPSWQGADHVAAAFVTLLILWTGGGLLWDNLQELIDRQADPEVLQTVRLAALDVPGVHGVETLRVRKAGLEYLVDIHIEVDPDLTVRAGHAIAHAVKDRVRDAVALVRDVLVHVEPAP